MIQTAIKRQVKFDGNKIEFNEKSVKLNFTEFMTESFGQWLERKRRAAGLNQTELAQRSRVTKATISLYERDGIDQPRRGQIDKIAKALGVSVDEARSKAGYASEKLEGTTLDIADDLRVSLLHGKDYTDEDKAEFEIGLGAAYEVLKARIEARKKRENK